jgi:hypothetical protein
MRQRLIDSNEQPGKEDRRLTQRIDQILGRPDAFHG